MQAQEVDIKERNCIKEINLHRIRSPLTIAKPKTKQKKYFGTSKTKLIAKFFHGQVLFYTSYMYIVHSENIQS